MHFHACGVFLAICTNNAAVLCSDRDETWIFMRFKRTRCSPLCSSLIS